MNQRPWICFFSQTGSEIVELTQILGKDPDIVVTNERPEGLRVINPRIKDSYKLVTVPNKPTVKDYNEVLDYFDNPLITLHGWLRIVPEQICSKYEIYNGHPGLITKYPELKGKDPQVRAYEGKYPIIGTVIHEVIPGVDEGRVLMSDEIHNHNLSIDDIFLKLKDISLDLWSKFLIKVLYDQTYNPRRSK